MTPSSAIASAAPRQPAPRDIELADAFVAELLANGAEHRSAQMFIELRGLRGQAPTSLRGVTAGVSPERVRQLVAELQDGPLRAVVCSSAGGAVKLRRNVERLVDEMEVDAPGSEQAIRRALAARGVSVQSPASAVRLADILGCHHGMRLTSWSCRAKFAGADGSRLASPEDPPRKATVVGIVPADMPEVFESFVDFARRISRGAGVVSTNRLADRFAQERGIPLSGAEAYAFLEPFAVHLGRHAGDEWFTFFNSANDLLRKAAVRLKLFDQVSFEFLCAFHRRYNRSQYANDESAMPTAVLRAALELAGYNVSDDVVTAKAPIAQAGAVDIRGRHANVVKVFRDTLIRTGRRRSIPRETLLAALMDAGMLESTALAYISKRGIIRCRGSLCMLADRMEADLVESEDQEAASAT